MGVKYRRSVAGMFFDNAVSMERGGGKGTGKGLLMIGLKLFG